MSTLIIGWNFDLKANNLNDEITNTTTPKSDGQPRAGGFNWGPIEVISESIPKPILVPEKASEGQSQESKNKPEDPEEESKN